MMIGVYNEPNKKSGRTWRRGTTLRNYITSECELGGYVICVQADGTGPWILGDTLK